MQTPHPVHKRIHQRIIQPPNHHPHRHPHQRVIEARKLPGSQVPRQHQHPFPPLPCRQIILQPLVPNKPACRLRRIPRHLAELSQQIPEVPVLRSQNPLPFLNRLLWKREFQISQPHPAQPSQPMKRNRSNSRTDCPSQPSWQKPQTMNRHPHRGKLHGLTQTHPTRS